MKNDRYIKESFFILMEKQHTSHDLGPPRCAQKLFKWSQLSFAFAYLGLTQTDKYKQVSTFREQCRLLIEVLLPLGCSLREIGNLFGSKNCVQKQFEKIKKEDSGMLLPVGRPKLFNNVDAVVLKAKIDELHSKSYFPEFFDIQEIVEDLFDVCISSDTARYVCKEYFGYTTCLAKSKEDKRLEVSENDIDLYFQGLKTILSGVNGRFILNIDETGVSEYINTQPFIVVTPQNFTSCAYIPVNRSERRCTGVVGIAPDGINPKPMIIVSRKTYDSEIHYEYPSDGYSISFQSKSFMTTRLFKKYLTEIIIPYFSQKRKDFSYEGNAIIIMDNLKAHENAVEELSEELLAAKILVYWIVPHASDQLQMLDVGIFSYQKRKYSHFRPNTKYQRQTRQIIKLLESIAESTTKRKCFSAFKQSGIFCDTTNNYYPHVILCLARSVIHYNSYIKV